MFGQISDSFIAGILQQKFSKEKKKDLLTQTKIKLEGQHKLFSFGLTSFKGTHSIVCEWSVEKTKSDLVANIFKY